MPTRPRVRALPLWLLLAFLLPSARAWASAPEPVRYTVTVTRPADRRFHITIAAAPDGPGPMLFAIPAWSPGYYQILDFQKDISGFKAVDAAGKPLRFRKLDDRTWEVSGARGTVTASYDVAAREAGFGFFACHIDDSTGYINGASAFMYVVGGKESPAAVSVRVPADWLVASPMEQTGPGAFAASGYDELVDSPIQMGLFDRVEFSVRGVPFSAIIVGQTAVNRHELAAMLTRVSAAGIELFGSAPFKRYYYIVHCSLGTFGGGLEHRNSTVLNVWGLPGHDPSPWMTLAAHEYFHAWNVKRIRPAVLGPFDYTRKVRTASLWFAEGVTDYYSLVLPRMAGLMSTQAFLDDLATRIGQLQRTDARKQVSAEDASRKSWEGGSMGYGGLSYYLKGSLLGLLFDIEIRSATDNRKSLDDVLRLLDEQYGRRNVGYDEDALLRAINQVSGTDMTDLYHRCVQTTDEIPWNSTLKLAGLVYREGSAVQPYLGVLTGAGARGVVKVLDVPSETPAAAAGLRENDQIVTVNGKRVPWEQWEAYILSLRPRQRVTLGLRRGGRAMDVVAVLGSRDNSAKRLEPLADADARALRVRAGLLRERSPEDVAMSSERAR